MKTMLNFEFTSKNATYAVRETINKIFTEFKLKNYDNTDRQIILMFCARYVGFSSSAGKSSFFLWRYLQGDLKRQVTTRKIRVEIKSFVEIMLTALSFLNKKKA